MKVLNKSQAKAANAAFDRARRANGEYKFSANELFDGCVEVTCWSEKSGVKAGAKFTARGRMFGAEAFDKYGRAISFKDRITT